MQRYNKNLWNKSSVHCLAFWPFTGPAVTISKRQRERMNVWWGKRNWAPGRWRTVAHMQGIPSFTGGERGDGWGGSAAQSALKDGPGCLQSTDAHADIYNDNLQLHFPFAHCLHCVKAHLQCLAGNGCSAVASFCRDKSQLMLHEGNVSKCLRRIFKLPAPPRPLIANCLNDLITKG